MNAESMLWLLLTGQIPTPSQSAELSRELADKGNLPVFIEKLIDSYVFFLPTNTILIYLTFIAFRGPCTL